VTDLKNRDIYQRDPEAINLLNNGVAEITDAGTEGQRQTLRFELEHFVCEGQYRAGLVRILETFVGHQGQPEQPAAWISGFFGSGKSHLAKMLRFLWTDFEFPEDGATVRGLARLPDDVGDLLTEISTLGKRGKGLHAAAGTLGSGAGDSVRLSLLGIIHKSADLPESYPLARFCLWLRKVGHYDEVRRFVESAGHDFLSEINDLYVSPLIAKALLAADPNFASDEKLARAALREQFPRPRDISTDELVTAVQDALAEEGEMPCTVVILDEVQQYIGEDAQRSYVVQEVVEACSKRFGDRLLFVGTGQTALSGTPALQRLQGRFTVNVELSDSDVETVTRRVVLAKRADKMPELKAVLEANAGEIDRHLAGTRIAPRGRDWEILADDYPLLPVRRRFWEHSLRAVDRAGTVGQLRTQLRMVYDAIRRSASAPIGTVVPADFLFEENAGLLLQSGELLREINETIAIQDDGTESGRLKHRLCALIFLVRKLPREAAVDIGVRADAGTLADLMVENLASDGVLLRSKLPALLDGLVDSGALMKLDGEYSLQTRESSEWEAEYRNRFNRLANDPTAMGVKRRESLGAAVVAGLGPMKFVQGECKEPRKLTMHFGPEMPLGEGGDVVAWVRDGWGIEEKTVLADARAAGQESPLVYVFVPKSQPAELAKAIASHNAAVETLDFKDVPSAAEGFEARQGMETRRDEAEGQLRTLVARIVGDAQVFQGGGNERSEGSLEDRMRQAVEASLDRLYPEFREADDSRWHQVIQRSRSGAEHPLEVLDFPGRTEEHPVCSQVLAFIGSGQRGREIRAHFSAPPYGWPRDAIDAALISLFGAGHLRATANGVALKPPQLDQAKVSGTDFRVESVTLTTPQRLQLRKLFQNADVSCRPNEESAAAGEFLTKLKGLAERAGGEPPLPKTPDSQHISALQSLAGNEQLLGVLEQAKQLEEDYKAWSQAAELADLRQSGYLRLLALAGHADGLAGVAEVKAQVDAIVADRALLASVDPLPALSATLTQTLRSALAQAESDYGQVFDSQMESLEGSDSWKALEPDDQSAIFAEVRINREEKGATGTEEEVLASLERISLDGWHTRTAALPQLFLKAQAEADKRLEPKVRHVHIERAILRSPEEVSNWVDKMAQKLGEEVAKGPIIVG